MILINVIIVIIIDIIGVLCFDVSMRYEPATALGTAWTEI